MLDDADAIGEALRHFENVGRQDDRTAPAGTFAQQVLHEAGGLRVEAGQRLVEHQEFWVVDQRAGQRHLLLHAARKTLAAGAGVVGEAERRQKLVGARLGDFRRHAPEAGDEFEIFDRGKLVIEHGLVRQPGGHALGGDRVAQGVDPEDRDFAGIGRQQAGHHAQRRRFAGAVGAEQRVEFARPDRQVEVVDRRLAEGFRQSSQVEGGF